MPIVLIADDKSSNREFLTTLLGYGGHHLLEAEDGEQALACVRQEHPDLVIADVLMPVMDGYEFVRRLRSDPEIYKTPVIFYTASYHETEARALAKACGVQDVIIKPAEAEDILASINRALGHAAPPEPAAPAQEFDRDHLRLLTDKLSGNVNALESANQRLADLLEVSRLLASEYDGQKLLEKFCPATRELIGARFAFVGVFSNQRVLQPVFASGVAPKIVAAIGGMDSSQGVLAGLATQEGPLRLADVKSDPVMACLQGHKVGEKVSFLGIRLSTPSGLYGLLWVLEKLGGGEFSAEDERVLLSLAAQAGVAYENAQRYEQIQQHAADLEHRVAVRTEELQEANKELEAFVYSVAHDLRAPLRQVHGFAKILMEEHGPQVDLPIREYIDLIQKGTVKMVALVDDLLHLSQVGRKDLQCQPTSLDRLVADVVRGLGAETAGREVEWQIGPLPTVSCDPVLMKQVFTNLLANAVKYTRPRPHAVIQVQALNDIGSHACTIMVRDNGVGFDMKYADKLFGVFQRLHSAEEFEGTGAGLAIVHRVLHRHGSRIWADAKPDKGATFYFTMTPCQTGG